MTADGQCDATLVARLSGDDTGAIRDYSAVPARS